ncbi:MAG: lysostaphin resistance A-like protein [Planctomycetaceae bacterium]
MTDLPTEETEPTEPTDSGDAPEDDAGSLFQLAETAGLFENEPSQRVPEDSSQWLSDESFLEAGEPDVRPPGPGLPESVAWMAGVLGLQLFAAAVVFFVLLAMELPQGPPTAKFLERLQRENFVALFAGIQAVSVIGIALAAYLRLGRERSRKLPLGPIPWQHLLIVFVAVLPMVALAAQLNVAAKSAWDAFTQHVPPLRQMEEMSSMKAVQEMAENVPLWGLLLMIAVAPAIAEELVFRGIIGRGLVARWGLPAGVAMTALMFAAMHVYPPQVFALLPLAVFLHLVYIASRSFWAPMLVHFLNNAFAVVVLKALLEDKEQLQKLQEMEQAGFSGVMFVSSAVCVTTLMLLTWKTRMRFLYDDGEEWDPGYPAVERPSESAGVVGECRAAGGGPWVMAGVGLAVFLAGIALVAVMKDAGWNV